MTDVRTNNETEKHNTTQGFSSRFQCSNTVPSTPTRQTDTPLSRSKPTTRCLKRWHIGTIMCRPTEMHNPIRVVFVLELDTHLPRGSVQQLTAVARGYRKILVGLGLNKYVAESPTAPHLVCIFSPTVIHSQVPIQCSLFEAGHLAISLYLAGVHEKGLFARLPFFFGLDLSGGGGRGTRRPPPPHERHTNSYIKPIPH